MKISSFCPHYTTYSFWANIFFSFYFLELYALFICLQVCLDMVVYLFVFMHVWCFCIFGCLTKIIKFDQSNLVFFFKWTNRFLNFIGDISQIFMKCIVHKLSEMMVVGEDMPGMKHVGSKAVIMLFKYLLLSMK